MYTYHKYQKSIATPLPTPETETHAYSSLNPQTNSGLPLENMDAPTSYPPQARETTEDRTQRLRDEFEGWGRESSTWSESGDEIEEDEVERRMSERDGKGVGPPARGRWAEWWAKEM